VHRGIGWLRLARDTAFNLLGHALPLGAAFFAIPGLIEGLGTDRFGILILAWMFIGYFSLFDFGLGRALTQLVAERVAETKASGAPPLAWTALSTMFLLGLVGAAVVGLLAPWLVHSVLRIPGSLHAEALRACRLLGAAIPIVVLTTGLVGVLSAFQRFGVINAIRAPLGVYGFLAPLAVLPYSRDLTVVTSVLVAGRLVACGAYVVACRPVMPTLRSGSLARLSDLRPLFRFGAWMTVTSIVSPLMVYLDRFVVGAVLSVSAVAYYATPFEMVTKLLVVPGAFLTVVFPVFAGSHKQDHARTVQLFVRGTQFIALILFPLMLLTVAFANEGLRWWLGDDFARMSTPVLQCLAIGVFVNGVAQMFATHVQAIGRPDLTAKLHLLELPIYLLVLWWGVREHGIFGAALAWTARVLLDAVLLFGLSTHLLGGGAILRRLAVGLLVALVALVTPALVTGIVSRGLVLLLAAVAFANLAWSVARAGERMSLTGWIRSLLAPRC
jgi:O-antigen/teichoic acid export membrane protein